MILVILGYEENKPSYKDLMLVFSVGLSLKRLTDINNIYLGSVTEMVQKNIQNNDKYFPFTPISNDFIESYLRSANPSFVIVYIYLAKESFTGNNITVSYIASKLNILQADVLTALNFWKEKGVINYTVDEVDLIQIDFLSIDKSDMDSNTLDTSHTNQNKADFNKSDGNLKIFTQNRPIYTTEEVNEFYKQEEIQNLMKMAERIFVKTFSYTDRNVLLGLYTWLGIPLEVLAVLFTYCANNNKTRVRYIEKVAIDWVDKGIDTVQKAEEYINVITSEYREIMRAFGFSRVPIDAEMQYMKVWLIDLKMPLDVIKEACKRTVLKTGAPNFNYADKTIKAWHKEGATTLEKVKVLTDEFIKKNSASFKVNYQKVDSLNQKPKIKQSRFINYEQPTYDFEKLRKLEVERLRERANEQ